MKHKYFFLTLVFFLTSTSSIAQNLQLDYQSCTNCPQWMNTNTLVSNDLFAYGARTAYTTGNIESDFDMRRANGNSRWHKGIDLRNHGAGADQQRILFL